MFYYLKFIEVASSQKLASHEDSHTDEIYEYLINLNVCIYLVS